VDNRRNIITPGISYTDRQVNLANEQRIRSNPQTIKEQIYEAAQERWGVEEADAVIWIVNNESSFRQYIKNGNCCGLFQRLNRCSDSILGDLNGQIVEGLDYIQSRYQTPSEAKRVWLEHKEKTGHGWY